jgi:hypothetical protein
VATTHITARKKLPADSGMAGASRECKACDTNGEQLAVSMGLNCTAEQQF